ncbi:cutinase family protein [Candidatus Saccharibacteria bacterium]|nr:cutinase family protein [Candidatus Saccharibacteria bacterium]
MRLRTSFFSPKLRGVFYNVVKITTAIIISFAGLPLNNSASASDESVRNKYFSCTDVKIIWARESGASQNDTNYQEFEKAFTKVFENSNFSYSFYELSREGGFGGYYYPAPGIGVSSTARFNTALGALVSGGNSYGYGKSVEAGANEAAAFIREFSKTCPNSKIILGGFSQGAQVVSLTLQKIDPKNLFYAATFGDPKLYLPEGKGINPPACRVENLSSYRAFVPDCHVYEGVLGGYNPYDVSNDFYGKVGAYCRYHDVICGVYTDLNNWYDGHADYIGGGLYEAAANTALLKMISPIPTDPSLSKKQNVAFLFDVTDSMDVLLKKYRAEALRAIKRVFDAGGSVALYTYGDLRDYEPVELCGFDECSYSDLKRIINNLDTPSTGSGDSPESLLSASYTLMKKLKWETGANKSVVVMTDAGFHDPDYDGKTLADVIKLSKEIDPVNFYILGNRENEAEYKKLASGTNGKVYLDDGAIYNEGYDTGTFANLIEDIFNHSESNILNLGTTKTESTVSNLTYKITSDSSAKISFDSTGARNILFLNDQILGILDSTEIELTDLDFSQENIVLVAPLSADGYRGTSARISLDYSESFGDSRETSASVVLKAPNSGRL